MATREEHLATARASADSIGRRAKTSPAFVAEALEGILHALLAQHAEPAPEPQPTIAPNPRSKTTRRAFSADAAAAESTDTTQETSK